MSHPFLSCASIVPHWPAPAHVKALMTTRQGGPSQAPFDAFNVGDHVGDDPAVVAGCRQQLSAQAGGTRFHWLKQVHGTAVVSAEAVAAGCEADAITSHTVGEGCVVMTADCLPVLLCDRQGKQIAAVHAGWRGLNGGVLEATVARMPIPSGELMAWLGPAIGPCCFEVGAEVRDAFVARQPQAAAAFTSSVNSLRGDRFMANLYLLARLRLEAVGVANLYGGGACTCCDRTRFYSYRRDGARTGRMAAAIWLG